MSGGKAYGFAKAPVLEKAPKEENRSIDFTGLDELPPVEVRPEKERAAVEVGERLGFRSREGEALPQQSTPHLRRAIAKVPQGKFLVTGPANVLDRFKAYSNEKGHRAYWETLAELMDAAINIKS